MASNARTVEVILTGNNVSAVRAIEGVGTAAQKTASAATGHMTTASAKIGGTFRSLDGQLASFGLPFTGVLGAIGAKLEATGGKAKTFGGTLSTIGGTSLIAAAAGLTVVGTASVKLASDFEASHARLKAAVAATGQSFSTYQGRVKNVDAAMIKLGFTSTETEASTASLTVVARSASKALDLQGLAANIARGRNVCLTDATSYLVKVLSGHIGLLGRLGINTKDATGHTIDQKRALELLSEYYKGQASAYAQTFDGKMAILSATTKQLGIDIGEALIPQIEKLASGAASGVQAFQALNASTDGWLGKILLAVGSVPAAVFIIEKLGKVAGSIGSSFATAGRAISNLATTTTTLVGGAEALETAEVASTVAIDAKTASLVPAATALQAEAFATAEVITAEEALIEAIGIYEGAAGVDVAASEAIAAASNEVAAAKTRQAIASKIAANAPSEGAAGVAPVSEVVSPSILAVAAPVLATAAAIGFAVYEGDRWAKSLRKDTDALFSAGQAAEQARGKFTDLIGPEATGALEAYRRLVQSGGSEADIAAAKQTVLADAYATVGANAQGGFTSIHANRGEVERVGTAARTAIGEVNKYSEAQKTSAGVTQTVADAVKAYQDDIASGHTERFATDSKNVTAAQRQQLRIQNLTNSALAAAAPLADDVTQSTDKLTTQTRALESAQKQYQVAAAAGNTQVLAHAQETLTGTTIAAQRTTVAFALATAQAQAEADLATGSVISLADAYVILGNSSVNAVQSAENLSNAAFTQFDAQTNLSSATDQLGTALDDLHGKNGALTGGGGGSSKTAAATALDQAQKELTLRDAIKAVGDETGKLQDAQLSLKRASEDNVTATKTEADAYKKLQETLHGVAPKSATAATAGEDLGKAKVTQKGAALDVKDAERDLAKARKSGSAEEVQRAELALKNARFALTDATKATNEAQRIYNGTLHGFKADSKEAKDAQDAFTTAQRGAEDAAGQLTTAQHGLRDAQDSVATSALALKRAQADMNGELNNTAGAVGAANKALDKSKQKLDTVRTDVKQVAIDVAASVTGSTGSVAAGILAEVGYLQQITASEPLLKNAFDDVLKNLRRELVSIGNAAAGAQKGAAVHAGPHAFFAEGGPVPGPVGAPLNAVVHGGEFVLSHDMLARGGGSRSSHTYHITVNSLDARAAGDIVVQALQSYARRNGYVPVRTAA